MSLLAGSGGKGSEARVERHCENIDFYVNEFLLYDGATPATDGVQEVGMFLGYWFIRKAMWVSTTSMRYSYETAHDARG